MAIPRFLYPSSVRAGGTIISASSEEVGFPAANLKDQLRSKVWRSKTGWTVVRGFRDEIHFLTNSDLNPRVAHIAPGYYATGAAYATAVTTAMAAAGASPLNPLNTTGWWRADSVVLDADGKVSQLTDLSGNGRHRTQATAGLRPLWVANALDGRPGMYFDGVTASQNLPSSANMSAFLGANGVGTVVIVFRLDSDASANDMLFSAGSSGHFAALYWTGSANLRAEAFDSSQKLANKTPGAAVANWHHGWWRYDQTNLSAFADDADDAAAANTAMTGALHADILGAPFGLGSTATDLLKGYIVEAIVWPTALTEAQRRKLTYYLRQRYPSLAANDATTAPTWTDVVTATYDGATHQFTLARTSGAGNVTLYTSTGILKVNAAFKDLGFTVSSDHLGASSYLAENAVYQGSHSLTVDLGAAAALTFGVALDHNAGASAGVLEVQGNAADVWIAPAFTQVLTGDAEKRLGYWSASSQRWWRLVIDDPTNQAGYSEVGIWDLGTYVAPAFCHSDAFSKVLDELSEIAYGTHGSHFRDERPQRWIWQLEWSQVLDADRVLFETLARSMKAGANFFIAWDPTGAPTDINFVFRREPARFNMSTGFPYWDIPLQLVEALD
jgi:hypothetical protein